MPEDHRVLTMWQALVDVAGASLLVGRGGANTCFYKFGDRERELDYPNKVLELLDQLARQSHVMYRIRWGTHEYLQYFSRERALKKEPQRGDEMFGVTVNGREELVYEARSAVNGRLRWIGVSERKGRGLSAR